MDVFVQLKGESPLGVLLYIFYDKWCDCGGSAPFRLEVEAAGGGYQACPLFGPVEVAFVVDDDLEFACQREYFREGVLEFFGR